MNHPLLIDRRAYKARFFWVAFFWFCIGLLVGMFFAEYRANERVKELKAHYETIAPFMKGRK